MQVLTVIVDGVSYIGMTLLFFIAYQAFEFGTLGGVVCFLGAFLYLMRLCTRFIGFRVEYLGEY